MKFNKSAHMKTPNNPNPKQLTRDAHQRRIQRGAIRRRKPKLKLYEISALVDYHSVILAASEKDALAHVATWDRAWHENADLIAVSDVQITDIRPLKAYDWRDEAHDRTCKVAYADLRQDADGEHGT